MATLRSTAQWHGRVSRLSSRAHYACLLVLPFWAILTALVDLPVGTRLSARVTGRVKHTTAAPVEIQVFSGHFEDRVRLKEGLRVRSLPFAQRKNR